MKYYLLLVLIIFSACASRQRPDDTYDVSVKDPAFEATHPIIVLDEAHNNTHTISGTYGPFAKLISNDGCTVRDNDEPFSAKSLMGADLLVIANAKGGKHNAKETAAFSTAECKAVKQWVEAGGSLLLIADHYPFGSAAQNLSQQFGVHMFNGETTDTIHGGGSFKDRLQFSSKNQLLAMNEITQGINSSNAVTTVIADRGQSLNVPDSAIVLLKLSESSFHALPNSIWTKGDKTYTRFADPVPAFGNCQGLAMKVGKGKVIILGEASMLTAQTFEGEKFGINAGDNDNKQFALNIVRWLLKK